MVSDAPLKICLLRLSAIGDTCNVVPTVRQLQTAFPASAITWIIGAVEHRLLGTLPGVEFITVDKKGDKNSRKALNHQLKSKQFDVLLNMHASMRANLLCRRIRATRKIGFDRARARDFQWAFCNESIEARHQPHVVDGFLQFAQHLGASVAPPEWNLPIDNAAEQFASSTISERSLVISPCSSDRRRNFRNWPVELYTQLANYAIEKHRLNIVLTGGATELEATYANKISANVPTTNLVGRTNLQELLAVLARASVLVCPDSGPAHMANAAGTHVIGLFATSNRRRTGPYLSQEFVADRYPEALETYLGKTIEQVRWGQRVRDPDAMSLITFDDVARQLDRVMALTN